MMFYLGNWKGKQVFEGIDKITLLFRVPWNSHLDPGLFHHKYIKLEKRQNNYTTYYYLTIHGEFINHDIDIADSITDAVLLLFKSEALKISKYVYSTSMGVTSVSYNDIPRFLVYSHLDLFFSGISEIEFFHDFSKELFHIRTNSKIIETNTVEYDNIKSRNLALREKCLVKCDNTYYSNDYRGDKRHSSIDFYDRTQKLIDDNNQYPISFLEKYPTIRLEFRCVRNNLFRYLTIYNLYGSYRKIFNRFHKVFARSYKKYFSGLIDIDTKSNECFNKVYLLSEKEKIGYSSIGLFRRAKKINDAYTCDSIFSRLIEYYYVRKYNLTDVSVKYPDYELFHPTYFYDEDEFSNNQYIDAINDLDKSIKCNIIRDDKYIITDLILHSLDILSFK